MGSEENKVRERKWAANNNLELRWALEQEIALLADVSPESWWLLRLCRHGVNGGGIIGTETKKNRRTKESRWKWTQWGFQLSKALEMTAFRESPQELKALPFPRRHPLNTSHFADL